MKNITTPLKKFQADAVENAEAHIDYCLTELGKLGATSLDDKNRLLIIRQSGTVLFEAPTGTGKTLMAGSVVERISRNHKILWLWVAPFAGLIDQAESTIRIEFPHLRPKSLESERRSASLRAGDVFVTTWQSVAVREASSRKVRTDTESLASLDNLLLDAREQNFRVGVVIDEAHHSFRGRSQAFEFYKNVIVPDVTIMATATPRDKDVETFKKETGTAQVNTIRISREQGYGAGLIKKGVKVGVLQADASVEGLIDFKKTAVAQGVKVHKRLQTILGENGLSVTPLLLVQVDDTADSVKEAENMLLGMGFTPDQIRSHTAAEPDPHLMTIAYDETVEVLIFKMAVATGFDVPRAFTLVSLRRSRDPDFGIQIVGRIMRVDRRLQGRKDLPEELNHGYVFLANKEDQSGLLSAADKINSIKGELAPLTRNVTIVNIPSGPTAQVTHRGGQTHFPLSPEPSDDSDGGTSDASETMGASSGDGGRPPDLGDAVLAQMGLFPGFSTQGSGTNTSGPTTYTAVPDAIRLRTDLPVPPRFQRAVVDRKHDDIVSEIVARFRFEPSVVNKAFKEATTVLLEVIDIFQKTKELPEKISAALAQSQIDAMAQRTLLGSDAGGMVDPRQLTDALFKSLKEHFVSEGYTSIAESDDKVEDALNRIIALEPSALKGAIDEAIKRHIVVEDADKLPAEINPLTATVPSRLNIYGIYPPNMNGWEQRFAEWLDQDTTGTVLWWHRNPVRRPYSVSIPIPGQPDYYPDFVVGIKNRKTANDILLVETKREINDIRSNAQAKSQAVHPTYGKVLMLCWNDPQQRWMTIEYDNSTGKNIEDRILRVNLLPVV